MPCHEAFRSWPGSEADLSKQNKGFLRGKYSPQALLLFPGVGHPVFRLINQPQGLLPLMRGTTLWQMDEKVILSKSKLSPWWRTRFLFCLKLRSLVGIGMLSELGMRECCNINSENQEGKRFLRLAQQKKAMNPLSDWDAAVWTNVGCSSPMSRCSSGVREGVVRGREGSGRGRGRIPTHLSVQTLCVLWCRITIPSMDEPASLIHRDTRAWALRILSNCTDIACV